MASPLTSSTRITLGELRRMKAEHRPIPLLTCYDFSTARALAAAHVPALLVGDSAAMTLLGESTTATLDPAFLLTLAGGVRKGALEAFLLADLPLIAARDPGAAVAWARRFVAEAGVDAVKVEVTAAEQPIISALAGAGISVCAHLGLLPQRVRTPAEFRAQGRTVVEAAAIADAAAGMEAAGAALILLEAVPDEVSQQVLARVGCPVIGCGAGPSCDGHVVVLHDMLGFNASVPRFVEVVGDVGHAIQHAAERYVADVTQRRYPGPQHTYRMRSEQHSPAAPSHA
jgi:3-methyl-2-oxobutanoate hydroxymethyltransferase